MGKFYLICGKIASGKTTYAQQLATRLPGILLSYDEILTKVSVSDSHNRPEQMEKGFKLFLLSLGMQACKHTNVILDWGFWTKRERKKVSDLLRKNNCEYEWHYVCASDEMCLECIRRRNTDIIEGRSKATYTDEDLLEKLNCLFEEPDPSEINVWHSRM